MKPDSLFHGVSSCDVLGFSGQQCDKGLALRTPGDGATINQEGISGDSMVVLIQHPISASVARDGWFLLTVDYPVVVSTL
jgi:hypothetical protein